MKKQTVKEWLAQGGKVQNVPMQNMRINETATAKAQPWIREKKILFVRFS
jgi:hypothetical protein